MLAWGAKGRGGGEGIRKSRDQMKIQGKEKRESGRRRKRRGEGKMGKQGRKVTSGRDKVQREKGDVRNSVR